MGVTGLWRLIEPAGKPVPVETLENKVLAVDISIWLHQMVKGYQDAKGAPLPNAHLIGLFQRLCKLLYFRIKPVFVFDGGFPALKKETIAKRQDNKSKYNSESERIRRELTVLLSKKTAISSLLGKETSPKKTNNTVQNDDDIFKLPALPKKEEDSETESEDEDTSNGSIVDLHSVDIESQNFKQLPTKDKYDLLIELKETRKMNSWGKLHELPKQSDNFSSFQMERLLKRRKVQECLEETEKEMGGTGMSLNELELLLNEEGIETKMDSVPMQRIASNVTTRYLLINNTKQALKEAKIKDEANKNKDKIKEEAVSSNNVKIEPGSSSSELIEIKPKVEDELEDDLQKAIKMSLECVDEAETSAYTSKTDDSWTSYLSDGDYSDDSTEEDGFEPPDLTSAKAYIQQYSDFTDKAINKLVNKKQIAVKRNHKVPEVNKIIEELNKEKSVIVDEVDVSSDEDCVKETNVDGKQEVTQIKVKDEIVDEDYYMDSTQSSVVYVENPKPEIIQVDTSIEECEDIVEKNTKDTKSPCISDNDSSDDDFEEVPESENKIKAPVVELTLNMNNDVLDDDIFADVFDEATAKDNSPEKPVVLPEKPVLPEKSFSIINNKAANVKIINKDNDFKVQNSKPNEIEDNVFKKPDVPVKAKVDTEVVDKVINQPTDDVVEKASIDKNTGNLKKDDNIGQSATAPYKGPTISTEQLNTMVDEMQTEAQDLLQEKGRLDRVGRNITEQMTKEAQELLQLFGVPYIVAPMEAEAQCAFLETVKLTDGTITDDSDIWLFGGQTVYKNFFNQKKHVLQFLAERIEKSFKLSREQLILLALLVGSDYTSGVAGVGPVTALEILASFPSRRGPGPVSDAAPAPYSQHVAGLLEFKQWVRAGKRTDNTSLKKKLKNVKLTDDFPSVRVVQAYMEPYVEKSKENFSWGELDVTLLRDYTKAKFGWSQHKLDEIIQPVIKRLQDRKSQKTVFDFFKRKVEFQSLEEHMSKRVKAAIDRMGPDGVTIQPVEEKEKVPKKRKTTKKAQKDDETAGPSNSKRNKAAEDVNDHCVKVVTEAGASALQIIIPKTDRYQEIIPQREKDKQSLLQNRLKAIEAFRKTNIDKKKKTGKRRPNLPKADAELSESDSD